MIRNLVASLLLTVIALAAQAASPGGLGVEVRAGNITLPNPDRGTITVKTCDHCLAQDLQVTSFTSYEIGDVVVRREDMRRELLIRPDQVMLLQLTPDRKHVARLKIQARTH